MKPVEPLLPSGYRYLGILGHGGMGLVYRVWEEDLGRSVAMKLLRPDLDASREARSRLVRETRLTAQLQHPAIPSVFARGVLDDGRPFFTMEEITGRTFGAVIADLHSVSPSGRWEVTPDGWTFHRTVDVLRRVCEAVGYAHARGIVHRDLKPSNIMVGSFDSVYVMDWGLARRPDEMAPPGPGAAVSCPSPSTAPPILGSAPLTRRGGILGTPAYMAPEQASGDPASLSPAADAYALGAILFELLAGHPPFRGKSGTEILQRRCQEGPMEAAALSPQADASTRDSLPRVAHPGRPGPFTVPQGSGRIPPTLAALCDGALAPEPGARPSAKEMARALRAWLEGEERRDRARGLLREALPLKERAHRLVRAASRLHARAQGSLDALPVNAPIPQKRPHWALLAEVEGLEAEADRAMIAYLQGVNASLTHAEDVDEAHAELADHYRAQHRDAEAARERREAARMERLIRIHDRRGRHRAYLDGAGEISLTTDPPGATLHIHRYVQEDRRLVPRHVMEAGPTPIHGLRLPMGSYLIELHHPGHQVVSYPVHLRREDVWTGVRPGESGLFPIWLPERGTLTEEEIYVPGGFSLVGGGSPQSQPSYSAARIWIDPFVMQRHPTPNAAYFAFLNGLTLAGRGEEAERYGPRHRGPSLQEPGPPAFVRDGAGRFHLPSSDDSPLPEWPVMQIDWAGARAYTQWLAEKSGMPWRLPWELEWERGARGADGRLYPWGDRFEARYCHNRYSHSGVPGPAPISDYPEDRSPFGVRGLGGNVRDWCLDPFSPRRQALEDGARFDVTTPCDTSGNDMRVIRGGDWYATALACQACVSYGNVAQLRETTVGVRPVRPLPICRARP